MPERASAPARYVLLLQSGMRQVETKYFGTMPYQDEAVFDFPFGLPAFEAEKRFVFIETPEYAPLVFLQSLSRSSLCFLALPIATVDPDYQLAMCPEDRTALDLSPEGDTPALALALVSLHDRFSPTANLMAPIVVNVKTRRALQAIRMDRNYSHQHPLSSLAAREGVC